LLRRHDVAHVALATTDYASARLGHEYTHWVGKPLVRFETDASGFALERCGGRAYRHPLVQCHLALQHFHQFLDTGEELHLDRFLAAGTRLADELRRVGMGGREAVVAFGHDRRTDYPPHPVPWVSAIHQGAVIRVLCRMWQQTGREGYLSAALAAAVPFSAPVERGGVVSQVEGAGEWYEEYPFPGHCRHVLNGFVSALFSLHELWRVTADASVRGLFARGVSALSAGGLDRFDTGYWSRYDLRPCYGLTPASLRYHNLHVLQLGVLSRLTGEACFHRVRARWAGYSRSPRSKVVSRIASACYRASQWRRYAGSLLLAAFNVRR
jgi:hypothetical protein